MKAKEKAKELVDMFQYDITEPQDYIRMSEDDAIESALICVDEMLKQPQTSDKQLNFLIEVKQEVSKL